MSVYPSDLERTFAEILVKGDPVRFDASDLMPGAVGSGAWWKNGTNYITGAETLDEFLGNVENAWPKK